VKPLDSYEAHQLERARLRYAQGKKSELLYWLHYCVMNNREIPAWIKEGLFKALEAAHSYKIRSWWPAPGSEDTELGVLMEPEVGHGETEVYPRVQA
jgi:hypothetical protein